MGILENNKNMIIKRVYRTLVKRLISGTEVSSGKGMFLDIINSFEVEDAEKEWSDVMSGCFVGTVIEVILRDTTHNTPDTYAFLRQSFIAYLNKCDYEVTIVDLKPLHDEVCDFLKLGS